MAAVQLTLLQPDAADAPHWALDGQSCARCADGRTYMVVASDPCTCSEAHCICLAEGYAKCDSCGSLVQVWPREMMVNWVAPTQD